MGGCAQTNLIDIPDTNVAAFQEKIVIFGLLSVGDTLQNIQIAHTIPVSEEPTDAKTAVKNAVVTLTVEDKIYPMLLQPQQIRRDRISSGEKDERSLYMCPQLVTKAGTRYSIEVRWNNKIATAETVTPQPSSLVSHRFYLRPRGNFQEMVLEGTIQPRPRSVYFLNQRHSRERGKFGAPEDFFGNVGEPIRNEDARANLAVFQSYIPLAFNQQLWDSLFVYTSEASIYVYDAPMWEYYTSTRQRSADIISIPRTQNPAWNVQGDGIGMFIGVATTTTVLPK
jgi:hypothetical protein